MYYNCRQTATINTQSNNTLSRRTSLIQ